jgi:N-methylhydantoinase B
MAQCGGEHGPWGATRHGDGENSMAIYQSNGIAPSVEAIEADAPVMIMRKEYAIDTGGAGHHRGGAAVRKDSLWLTDGEHYSSMLHAKSPSGFGVYGGCDGHAGGVWFWNGGAGQGPRFVDVDDSVYATAVPVAGVMTPDGHVLDAERGEYFSFARSPVWTTLTNAVFRYQTNAGGGWGVPLTRDPARVLRDVRNEYVSLDAARELYGVIIRGDQENDPEGLTVDLEETDVLRGRLSRRQEPTSCRAASLGGGT